MTPWDLSSDGWSASYSTRYDFAGNVTGTLESHTSPSGETHNVKTNLTLDPRGNVLSERLYADGSLVSETEYDYDESGNMTSDSRKSLEISSNVLNLPMTVSETTGTTVTNTMTYTYLGDGTKAGAMAGSPDAGGHTGMRYRGSFVYDVTGTGGQTLQSIAVSTGKLIAVTGNNGSVSFESDGFICDHLGNVAAVVNLSAPASTSTANFILEQNDYLPFGSRIALKEQSSNRYRYAGKEEQDIAGMDLSLLDFGARYYDAFVGRWNAIDLMAILSPSISPFVYCISNPIKYTDPNGMLYTDSNGVMHGDIGDTLDIWASAMGMSPEEAARQLESQGNDLSNFGENTVYNPGMCCGTIAPAVCASSQSSSSGKGLFWGSLSCGLSVVSSANPISEEARNFRLWNSKGHFDFHQYEKVFYENQYVSKEMLIEAQPVSNTLKLLGMLGIVISSYQALSYIPQAVHAESSEEYFWAIVDMVNSAIGTIPGYIPATMSLLGGSNNIKKYIQYDAPFYVSNPYHCPLR